MNTSLSDYVYVSFSVLLKVWVLVDIRGHVRFSELRTGNRRIPLVAKLESYCGDSFHPKTKRSSGLSC